MCYFWWFLCWRLPQAASARRFVKRSVDRGRCPTSGGYVRRSLMAYTFAGMYEYVVVAGGGENPSLFASLSRQPRSEVHRVHCLKLRLHQQQCRSNIVEATMSNDYVDKVERCFDVVWTSFSWNFVLSTKSKQTEHVQFVSALSKGRNFAKNAFDFVAKKRHQCRSNIQLCRHNRSTCSIRQCWFDIVAPTLLLHVWTGLKRKTSRNQYLRCHCATKCISDDRWAAHEQWRGIACGLGKEKRKEEYLYSPICIQCISQSARGMDHTVLSHRKAYTKPAFPS